MGRCPIDLLEPGDVPARPGQTELSRLCEGIALAFLRSGARTARVRVEDTPFDAKRAYKALWSMSLRSDFRGTYDVHMRGGEVYLARRGR